MHSIELAPVERTMPRPLTIWPAESPRIDPSAALHPFLKWPGGKTHELAGIAAAAPPLAGRFIDPFVGGGSVLLATPAEVPALANDACRDLIQIYHATARGDALFRAEVDELARAWDALAVLDGVYSDLARSFTEGSDPAGALAAMTGAGRLADAVAARTADEVPAKFARIRRVEAHHGRSLSAPDLLANVEGAVRSSFYMSVRARYNEARRAGRWDATRAADFLFLREFAYAAMFRFNRRDEFNVPYGGVSYNRQSFTDKARWLFGLPMLARLSNTRFEAEDFEPFLERCAPARDDFVFVDPPYDSDFSAYDNRSFDGPDQVRLERILAGLDARVMVVIKDAPAIRSLYQPDRWNMIEAPKTYMWTIKSRNDRSATHLTITNYPRPND
ncbi:MAG: DNA adenine methylase [Candidatus Limnocylindrales bacterium]